MTIYPDVIPQATQATQAQIARLQRELIAHLRGEVRHLNARIALAALNGDFEGATAVRTHSIPMERIRQLRGQLLDLDPKACIFESWGGPMPVGHRMRRDDYGDLTNGPERAPDAAAAVGVAS